MPVTVSMSPGAGIGVDLAAEVADEGVDGALVAFVFVAAGPVDELVAGEYPARDAGQGGEEFPFGGGEAGGLAVRGDLVAGLVDEQLAAAVGRRLVTAAVTSGAAEDGADPEHHFAGAERLGDVVIGAEFQAVDAVGGGGLGGEHQDRDGRLGADFTGDVLTGHVGQPQVQHDQVRAGLAGEGDRLGPGPGGDDGEPVMLEIGAQQVTDLPLVLDNQHALPHCHHLRPHARSDHPGAPGGRGGCPCLPGPTPLTAAPAAALPGTVEKSRGRLLGPLGWRLFAAFTLVGVGAVALLAVLAVVSVRSQTSGLVASQRDQAGHDIAAALSAAYARAGSWQKADLAGAQALADSTGARLIILGASGGQVTIITPAHMPGHEPGHEPGHGTGGTTMPGMDHGGHSTQPPRSHHQGDSVAVAAQAAAFPAAAANPAATPSPAAPATATPVAGAVRVPVVAGGRQVGTVLVSFPPAAQTSAWQARDAILRAVGAGALLAVLLAAAAALWVSRRTTRPLTALAAAAGAVERGDPDAVSLLRPGPGELGQVSAAFAAMAGTLQREDELRRAMVADTAHELRTPVTILRGATEELLDGLAEPSTSKLTSLHDEVLRLERLVDDLSALAAAQSAALTLDCAPADLAKIAVHASGELQPMFEDAEVRLDVDTSPVMVHADQARLTQIVTNLLTNAAKFTPPGGHVTLTTRPAGATAELTVTDTGPGIPPGDLPHIFERFWRGTAAAGRAGTGIGLGVVAELTAAHGGTITAASPPGGGTAFTLTLPAS